MSTSSPGSAEPPPPSESVAEPVSPPPPADDGSGKLRQRLMLVVIGLILVGGLVVGVQLFRVVYGLVFPEEPPLPDAVTEVRHSNIAYGVDEWLYTTQQDACAVTQYYIESGGTCVLVPGMCSPNGFDPQYRSQQHVSDCSGVVEFSIFEMRWEATISGGYSSGDPTRFILRREVFWIGSAPRSTPAD